MVWFYEGKPASEEDFDDAYGIVYEIENLETGKKYIGKKLLFFKTTKIRKGKKIRSLTESDWKTYYGSNKELKEDVEKLGLGSFKRSILKICKNKGECSYWEAKHIFERDAILSDDYYNSWISVKVSDTHVKAKVKKNKITLEE